MTVVESGVPDAPESPATGIRGQGALARFLTARATEHAVVLGGLVVVVSFLAHAEGGRAAGALGPVALATLLAVLVTRPWRRLRGPAWLLAALVGPAALVVLLLHGPASTGGVAATTYAVATGWVVAVAAYARTRSRRAGVASVLCAGGVAQFAWALVPWWGGGDPSSPMVGTYYWHNQYAVALMVPALLGLALALGGHRPWRSVGWIAVGPCAAGVVLSTSRSTLGLLLVGWLAVATASLVSSPDHRRTLVRLGIASGVALGLTLLLPGPPLFDSGASPLAGHAVRSATGETVGADGAYRTEFWRESLTAAGTSPVLGVGYGRIAEVAGSRVPADWAISPLAHSGPLQALAEGGLLLGLPVAAAVLALCVAVARRLRLRAAAPADTLLVRTAGIVTLLLVVHSLVDTDWTYPALAAQLGVVAGLALAVRPPRPEPVEGPDHRLVAARWATALLVLSLATGAAVSWGQSFHISDTRSPIGGGTS